MRTNCLYDKVHNTTSANAGLEARESNEVTTQSIIAKVSMFQEAVRQTMEEVRQRHYGQVLTTNVYVCYSNIQSLDNISERTKALKLYLRVLFFSVARALVDMFQLEYTEGKVGVLGWIYFWAHE